MYPRYLANHLPKEGKPVCIVGQVMDISENNSLTIDCDPDSKPFLILDKQSVLVEVPGNVEIAPLKQAKFV